MGQQVTREEGVSKITTTFVVKKGILRWQVQRNTGMRVQTVVPRIYHQRLLHLAHDMPMAGHLAVQRTLDRLSQAFYWPGVDGDVHRYCASCDSCQRHARKKVKKVPLQNVPVVGLPFSKVAVDLIGPFKSPSQRGHRYVLMVMDYATRYADAVPLQHIDLESVAEAM